jgi:hypothetical protein
LRYSKNQGEFEFSKTFSIPCALGLLTFAGTLASELILIMLFGFYAVSSITETY